LTKKSNLNGRLYLTIFLIMW